MKATRTNDRDGTESTDLEPRDARALTEHMTVLEDVDEAHGAPELFLVVGENGSSYLVDAREGRCECPDARHRDPDGGCKHVRRVAFATGERAVPTWVDRSAIDAHLGAHVDATPRVATADGGEILDAGDEGEILDDEEEGRPEDCDCGAWNADAELPCWPCYREGFETPAGGEGDA